MILTAIKKTFEIYCWVEVPLCLLCQGEINHSVPGGKPAGIGTDCAIWPYVEIDYAFPHLSILKFIHSVYRRFMSDRNKQMMALPSRGKRTVVLLFITGCFTLITSRIWHLIKKRTGRKKIECKT